MQTSYFFIATETSKFCTSLLSAPHLKLWVFQVWTTDLQFVTVVGLQMVRLVCVYVRAWINRIDWQPGACRPEETRDTVNIRLVVGADDGGAPWRESDCGLGRLTSTEVFMVLSSSRWTDGRCRGVVVKVKPAASVVVSSLCATSRGSWRMRRFNSRSHMHVNITRFSCCASIDAFGTNWLLQDSKDSW